MYRLCDSECVCFQLLSFSIVTNDANVGYVCYLFIPFSVFFSPISPPHFAFLKSHINTLRIDVCWMKVVSACVKIAIFPLESYANCLHNVQIDKVFLSLKIQQYPRGNKNGKRAGDR